MDIHIPDQFIRAAEISRDEIIQELAVSLFQQDRLTLEGASRLAGLDQISFQRLLASRCIPLHYDISDLESDVATLERMGML